MSEKRYFFFDYDGTLTTHYGAMVPDSAKKTLDRLRAEGHFVALATGRLQVATEKVARELGLCHYVSDGGSGITLNHQLIDLKPMPTATCHALIRELDELGIPWAVTVGNECLRHTPDERFPEKVQITSSYMTTVVEPGLRYESLDNIMKIFVACKRDRQDGIVSLRGMPGLRFTDECFIAEATDKADGIRRLMAMLGAPLDKVVVFGDGTNDLSMFSPEWTSVAMGNGVPALKERADFVTKAALDDGIRHACYALGFLQ